MEDSEFGSNENEGMELEEDTDSHRIEKPSIPLLFIEEPDENKGVAEKNHITNGTDVSAPCDFDPLSNENQALDKVPIESFTSDISNKENFNHDLTENDSCNLFEEKEQNSDNKRSSDEIFNSLFDDYQTHKNKNVTGKSSISYENKKNNNEKNPAESVFTPLFDDYQSQKDSNNASDIQPEIVDLTKQKTSNIDSKLISFIAEDVDEERSSPEKEAVTDVIKNLETSEKSNERMSAKKSQSKLRSSNKLVRKILSISKETDKEKREVEEATKRSSKRRQESDLKQNDAKKQKLDERKYIFQEGKKAARGLRPQSCRADVKRLRDNSYKRLNDHNHCGSGSNTAKETELDKYDEKDTLSKKLRHKSKVSHLQNKKESDSFSTAKVENADIKFIIKENYNKHGNSKLFDSQGFTYISNKFASNEFPCTKLYSRTHRCCGYVKKVGAGKFTVVRPHNHEGDVSVYNEAKKSQSETIRSHFNSSVGLVTNLEKNKPASSTVKFILLKNCTKNGNSKLFDSNGYTYNVISSSTSTFRCTCTRICKALVKKIDDNYKLVIQHSNHDADIALFVEAQFKKDKRQSDNLSSISNHSKVPRISVCKKFQESKSSVVTEKIYSETVLESYPNSKQTVLQDKKSGYLYILDKNINGNKFYRCQMKQDINCSATVRKIGGQYIRPEKKHNHRPDKKALAKYQIPLCSQKKLNARRSLKSSRASTAKDQMLKKPVVLIKKEDDLKYQSDDIFKLQEEIIERNLHKELDLITHEDDEEYYYDSETDCVVDDRSTSQYKISSDDVKIKLLADHLRLLIKSGLIITDGIILSCINENHLSELKSVSKDWIANFVKKQNFNNFYSKEPSKKAMPYLSFLRLILEDKFEMDIKMFMSFKNSHRIFCCDGIEFDLSSSVYDMNSVNVLCCASANGDSLLPVLVNKGGRVVNYEGFESYNAMCSRSGKITLDLFYKWLTTYFSEYINDMHIEKPVVLFLDGSNYWVSIESFKFAVENEIVLFHVPGYISDSSNPLKSLFSILKIKRNTEVICPKKSLQGVPVKKFANIFCSAYKTTFRVDKIKSSFSDAGLCPLNRKIFNDHEKNYSIMSKNVNFSTLFSEISVFETKKVNRESEVQKSKNVSVTNRRNSSAPEYSFNIKDNSGSTSTPVYSKVRDKITRSGVTVTPVPMALTPETSKNTTTSSIVRSTRSGKTLTPISSGKGTLSVPTVSRLMNGDASVSSLNSTPRSLTKKSVPPRSSAKNVDNSGNSAKNANTSRSSAINADTSTSRSSAINADISTSRRSAINADTSTSPSSAINADTSTSRRSAINADTSILRSFAINADTSTSQSSAINADTSTSRSSAINANTLTSQRSALNADTSISQSSAINSDTSTSRNSVINADTLTSRSSAKYSDNSDAYMSCVEDTTILNESKNVTQSTMNATSASRNIDSDVAFLKVGYKLALDNVENLFSSIVDPSILDLYKLKFESKSDYHDTTFLLWKGLQNLKSNCSINILTKM